MEYPSEIFIDTSFIIGLYNRDDNAHQRCMEVSIYTKKAARLITTDAVLMELGNTFSVVHKRQKGARIIREFLKMKRMEIINLTPEYFEDALKLYEERPDKEWGMVDCFSFVVMNKFSVETAFTLDKYFRQAGFNVLPL